MKVCIIGDLNETSNSAVAALQLEKCGVDLVRIWPGTSLKTALRQIRDGDVLYGVARSFSWRLFAGAKILGKLTVHHWIGTDVLRAISDRRGKWYARLTNFFVDRQLVVAPHLGTELASIGIQSSELPIVPDFANVTLRTSLPKNLSVMSYLPNSRPDFYGADIIYKLAKEFQQLKFIVVAGTSDVQPALPNIKYLGFVQNMDQVYETAPILVRMPKHDGLPKMILEALAKGNQVIHNYPFPHCYQAGNFEEAAICLAQILAEDCPVNTKGHYYVFDRYNQQAVTEQLITALQK